MFHIDEDSWHPLLQEQCVLPYFQSLSDSVSAAYLSTISVYPPAPALFRAFELCPLPMVKVVILGQDPYHGAGQAQGLSFSVPDGVALPPSLRNIYKEIQTDCGSLPPQSGNLERWAQQGVLLLNATLTVHADTPGSHQRLGWEFFTDAVIQKVSDTQEHVVFLLWGKFAQAKAPLIDAQKHLVLIAPHPSPFSAYTGFFGCKHFSQTNKYLISHGQKQIIW